MASGYSDLSEIQKNNGLYGAHQKPPKINLISEQPRRESVVERQLTSKLARTNFGPPTQQVQQQVNFNYSPDFEHSSQAYAHDSFSNVDTSDWAGNPIGYTTTSVSYDTNRPGSSTTTTTTRTVRTQQQQQQQQQQQSAAPNRVDSVKAYSELVNDLAEKEAKLKREMAYLNQQLSPWSRPRQVRSPRQEPERCARSRQRWVKECPSSRSSSRPTSRASSTRSNTEADLMEKTAKLLQDAVEIEKKPLKKREVLIENSARRTEVESSPSEGVSSIHTAIINVPNTEIDNKSPLPFAYDNFSTLGVRGNIASVGAAPPETPYPPIFPIVKRTPSPANRMY